MPIEKPLKTKISTWNSFYSLFSGPLDEVSLYIPTPRRLDIGQELPLLLHLPQGEALGLNCRIVHVFGDRGQTKGAGVCLVRLTRPQRDRLHALQHEARLRVGAPAQPMEPSVSDIQLPGPARRADSSPTGRAQAPAARPAAPAARTPNRALPTGRDLGPATRPLAVKGGPPEGSQALAEGISEREHLNFSIPHPALLSIPEVPDYPLVGIDFGTTRSSVAVVQNNEVMVLQAPNGMWDIPSVVGFNEMAEPVVGTDAREMFIIDPSQAIMSPKRLLGRMVREREIEAFLASLAIRHSEGPHGEVLLHPRGKALTVPQVCAPLLFALRVMAQEFLGAPVNEAVLTVPVSFDDYRRRTLQEAAYLAGLHVSAMVEEPTAAVLAHHFHESFEGLVAVYDFGGGTFDFSLVEVQGSELKVVSTAGDIWLGGDDFDLALATAAANAFWHEHQVELQKQVVRWQRLLVAAEKAKRELSFKERTVVGLPDAALTASGPVSLRFPVTRQHFTELSMDLIERSLDTCRQAMELQGIDPRDVNTVYLCGGTSGIPCIREELTKLFGSPPLSVIPPERAVVIGAALSAAQLYAMRR